MRKYLIITVLVIITGNSFAQNAATPKSITFPGSFIGNWKGTLEWILPGATEPRKVNMELRIQPLKDSAGQYSWNLIYGTPTEDNRPYILKPVDTAKGHWKTDELNGIILDGYWIGNKFCSAFTVLTTTIINNCWLEDDKLIVEFISLTAKPVATTGQGTKEIPSVDSYGVKSYQKAILER